MASVSTSTTTFPSAGEEKRQQTDSTMSPSEESSTKEAVTPAGSVGNEREKKYITGTKLFIVTAAVTCVTFLMLLDIVILVTAIPAITDQFHSLPDVGWYGASYTLANASLVPMAGKFYQYFSSKWVYLCCLGLFEIGSLLCAVSQSSVMLIVSRSIAGMGSAGLSSGAFTIIAGAVPMEKSPALIGAMMGVSQLGLVLGPVIGGAFTQYATWRWCFYINLPLGGIAAALLVFIDLPDQIPKDKFSTVIRTVWTKLDLIGFGLFAPAAIMFLLAIQYGGNQYPWSSATVIGLFCGSAAVYVLFGFWEYRMGEEAMIPPSMVSKRIVLSGCLHMLFLFGVVYITTYYLPIYFQVVKGNTPTISGVNLFPSILIQLLFAVISGAMVQKLGYYLPWGVLSGVLTAIASGLFSTFSPTTSTATWAGFQAILGAGNGSGIQIAIIALQNAVPPEQVALVSALAMFSQTFGSSVFLAASNTILVNSLRTQVVKYAPSVDAEMVVHAGATGVRKVVLGADLAGVLEAYAESIDRVFYLAAGCGVACFVVAFGTGWKDIRVKKPIEQA